MSEIQFLTITEQVAAYLHGELMRGRWRDSIPGKHRLTKELDVNNKTVEAALQQLEREGILEGQGAGRRRKIVVPASVTAMRVAILCGDLADKKLEYIIELEHELGKAGHAVIYTPRSMDELQMDVSRIARMVSRIHADAWVVLSGSKEVLEWFADQQIPTLALFGRRRRIPIAAVGPDKRPAFAAVTRALIELGHRNISLLVRTRRRLPQPGAVEQIFLNELLAHGLPISDYNLPGWEETIEGFHARLESMFQRTPPTALIVDEAPFYIAALQFLGQRRLRVPEDVSLVCTDEDPSFAWCQPAISHIRWDSRPVVRRIIRWAANVSTGKSDLRQTLTSAEFVRGGTIGPVRIDAEHASP